MSKPNPSILGHLYVCRNLRLVEITARGTDLERAAVGEFLRWCRQVGRDRHDEGLTLGEIVRRVFDE